MYLFHTKRYSVTENVSQHKSGPVKSTDWYIQEYPFSIVSLQ